MSGTVSHLDVLGLRRLPFGGAAVAAMLDLLALHLHGRRPVSDDADRLLETDALQASLSGRGVTDILGCSPRSL